MARITYFGSNGNVSFHEDHFRFSSYVGHDADSYTYTTTNGYTVTLYGTGIEVNGSNRPSDGTVQRVEISAAGDPSTLLLEIEDLFLSTYDFVWPSAGFDPSSDEIWDAINAGDTELVAASGGEFYRYAGDRQDVVDETLVGSDNSITGLFTNFSYLSGTADNADGSAVVYGGSLTFNGFAYYVIGDVESARGDSRVIGGDDIIRTQAGLDQSTTPSTVYYVGDVGYIRQNSIVVGGDDYLRAVADDDTKTHYLDGDGYSITDPTATLIGGDDVIYGNDDGTNYISGDVGFAVDGSTVIGGDDLIYGGAAADNIAGDSRQFRTSHTGGHDTIFGGGGDDLLEGNGGNDKIVVGNGDSTARGGDGDDLIRIDGNGATLIEGGAGIDTLSYYFSKKSVDIHLDFMTADGGYARDDQFTSIENAIGSQHDDRLFGSLGANSINGSGGDDVIDGQGGRDIIDGGAGNDYMFVRNGAAQYTGGAGFDLLDYGSSDARVNIDLQHNIAKGGYARGDTIANFEYVYASDFNDLLRGTGGSNRVRGQEGNDKIWGRGGVDLLEGNKGNDSIYGGGGFDFVRGGQGNDYMEGNGGADEYRGGGGADTFHFNKGDGYDTILDFQNNVDTLEFDNYGNSFNPMSKASQVGSDVIFNLGNGNVVKVNDITLAQIQNDIDVV